MAQRRDNPLWRKFWGLSVSKVKARQIQRHSKSIRRPKRDNQLTQALNCGRHRLINYSKLSLFFFSFFTTTKSTVVGFASAFRSEEISIRKLFKLDSRLRWSLFFRSNFISS
jgi:hypothetical protein